MKQEKTLNIRSKAVVLLLTLAMAIGMIFAMTQTAYAAGVPFLDNNGNLKTHDARSVAGLSGDTWQGGWYVVDSDVSISDRLIIEGDVHLILADGKTLTADQGIHVSKGNNLTIYGQYQGTGKLKATGNGYAAIGGNFGGYGNITINGGIVTATGYEYCAGIGTSWYDGGDSQESDTITINGGRVMATGGNCAAGIGSGASNNEACFDGVSVIINGGTVTANGGRNAAGIGGGFNRYNVNVTVNGGSSAAISAGNGEGIGLGYIDPSIATQCSVAIGQDVIVYAGDSPNPTTDVTSSFPNNHTQQYVKTEGPHNHRFEYTGDGATITARCLENDHCYRGDQTATLSLNKTSFVYGEGITPTVTVSNGWTTENRFVAPPTTSNVSYVNQSGTAEYNNSQAPTKVGDYTAVLTINAYDGAKTARVNFSIGKADNPAEVADDIRVKIGGNTIDLAKYVYLNGATGEVSYRIKGSENGWILNGSMLTSGNDENTVTVEVTVAADDKYKEGTRETVVSVSDRDTQFITASNVNATYGDTDKKVRATTDGDGQISYAVRSGSEDYIDVDPSTGALTLKKAGTATVTVTASATPTYNKATRDVTVKIGKADPKVSGLTATATYGQTLADVKLINPDENTKGELFWADDRESVGSVGTHTFWAYFIPDSDNYNTKENVPVAVTVVKAANPATVDEEGCVKRGGNTVDLADYVHRHGAVGDVKCVIDGNSLGCSVNGSVLTSGNKTGSITLLVRVLSDDNYETLTPVPIRITINDKDVQTIAADDLTVTYGEANMKVRARTDGDGSISYEVDEVSEDYIDVDAVTGLLTVRKVPAGGEAYVTVTAAETPDYNKATRAVTVTINKADSVAATVSANNRTYDGTKKELVTVDKSTLAGGIMKYALTTENTEPADESAYTATIPAATNAGTYYVWYHVQGDENHTDTAPASVKVTISEAGKKPQDPPASKSGGLILAKMTTKGSKAMMITWAKADGANGYDIFFSRCNHNGTLHLPRLTKSIDGNGTFKWTKKGLKKGKAYKVCVKAYVMKNGQKVYISESPEVHGYAGGWSKKYTNPKSVKVSQSAVTMNRGQSVKVKASVKKLKKGKKLISTAHAAKLRCFSSDEGIATMDGSGVITGRSKGSCTVYVLAANGVRQAITVTVR